MITSGLVTLILFEVSSYENKFVSSLVEGIIVISLFLSRTLFNDLPTKPLLPKIKNLNNLSSVLIQYIQLYLSTKQ